MQVLTDQLQSSRVQTEQVGELIELLAKSAIRPRVAARLPLADAAEAQHLVESGQALGRVILKP